MPRRAEAFLPFVRPRVDPSPRLLAGLAASLRSGRLTNGGPALAAFEGRLASYLGASDAVGVANGSDALLLACRALGLKGKAVLPSFTYIATLSAFVNNGLEPVFCDIEPGAWTMAPEALESILRRHRVAAVCPVNVFGQPPDLAALAGLARRAGAALLYDNAHGFGTSEAGRRLSPLPDAQTFSFHATKLLCAVEGGAVVSPDGALLDRVRRLRNHGLAPDLLDSLPGHNAKLDELRARVGLHSLERLDAALRRRRAYARRLLGFIAERCGGLLEPQARREGVESNFQNLGVLVKDAGGGRLERVVEAFRRRGVEARRYFHPPLHRLRMFGGRSRLPVTDRVAGSVLCLPLYDTMTEASLERIERAALRACRS